MLLALWAQRCNMLQEVRTTTGICAPPGGGEIAGSLYHSPFSLGTNTQKHNLVDILIYKQSLMKFLSFINNTLSPPIVQPFGVC